VIFDLDGTLVQTRIASWAVFAKISERFGLGITNPQEYYDLFRGNVFASIERLCPDRADAVTSAFLDLLRDEYTPPMVPGMIDVVRRLAARSTLAVLSSNATQVLRRVLVANDLAFCFAHVFGGDVVPDKRVAIESFLADAGSAYGRRCAADYDEAGEPRRPEPATTVLVTDTAGDVQEALAAGIRAVGVAWGMHSVAELTTAGAEFVALWPQELSAHLLGDVAALPPNGACALPDTGRAPNAGSTGCGCGCDRSAPRPGAARRDRRRGAARTLAARTAGARSGTDPVARPATTTPTTLAVSEGGVVPVGAELLVAVRRVCGRG
jgi:phosphoglycolate phosphatase